VRYTKSKLWSLAENQINFQLVLSTVIWHGLQKQNTTKQNKTKPDLSLAIFLWKILNLF